MTDDSCNWHMQLTGPATSVVAVAIPGIALNGHRRIRPKIISNRVLGFRSLIQIIDFASVGRYHQFRWVTRPT